MAQQLAHPSEPGVIAGSARRDEVLLGFILESESMPGDDRGTLYTLTHPDLPGFAYSGTDSWECLLAGVQAAGRIIQHRMEAGEKLIVKSTT